MGTLYNSRYRGTRGEYSLQLPRVYVNQYWEDSHALPLLGEGMDVCTWRCGGCNLQHNGTLMHGILHGTDPCYR